MRLSLVAPAAARELADYGISDISVSERPLATVFHLHRGASVATIIRPITGGEPIRLREGEDSREAIDAICEGLIARLPAGVAAIPGLTMDRGWTFMLPEPERHFAGETPRLSPLDPDRATKPGGSVFAERNTQAGRWELFASSLDWNERTPFAVASPDLTLDEVWRLASARRYYDDLGLSGQDADGHLALIVSKEGRTIPVAALMSDPVWRRNADRASDRALCARIARMVASVAAEDRSAADAAGHVILDARRGERAKDRYPTIPAIAIALGLDDIRNNVAAARFEALWERGGSVGFGPALCGALATTTGRPFVVAVSVALGVSWRLNIQQPRDAEARARFEQLVGLDPALRSRIAVAANAAGLDTTPLAQPTVTSSPVVVPFPKATKAA